MTSAQVGIPGRNFGRWKVLPTLDIVGQVGYDFMFCCLEYFMPKCVTPESDRTRRCHSDILDLDLDLAITAAAIGDCASSRSSPDGVGL